MLRFTIREVVLATLAVAICIAWWMDGWQSGGHARDTFAAIHEKLLSDLRTEVQRVANQTGTTVEIRAGGYTFTGTPQETKE